MDTSLDILNYQHYILIIIITPNQLYVIKSSFSLFLTYCSSCLCLCTTRCCSLCQRRYKLSQMPVSMYSTVMHTNCPSCLCYVQHGGTVCNMRYKLSQLPVFVYNTVAHTNCPKCLCLCTTRWCSLCRRCIQTVPTACVYAHHGGAYKLSQLPVFMHITVVHTNCPKCLCLCTTRWCIQTAPSACVCVQHGVGVTLREASKPLLAVCR